MANSDQTLFNTDHDTRSRTYIGGDMRVNMLAPVPRLAFAYPGFHVQERRTDRLGGHYWLDSTKQPTRAQIRDLAGYIIKMNGEFPIDRWESIAGPYERYRVLVRNAGRISRFFGRPYTFAVEYDRGSGGVERWMDADIAPLPLARLAFLLKQELGDPWYAKREEYATSARSGDASNNVNQVAETTSNV